MAVSGGGRSRKGERKCSGPKAGAGPGEQGPGRRVVGCGRGSGEGWGVAFRWVSFRWVQGAQLEMNFR